jgi:hypothetical protein
MTSRLLMFLWLALVLPCLAGAQEASERPLPLNGRIAADGSSVTLDWLDAAPPRVGSVQIKRRHLGDIGGASWITIAPDLGVVMQFTDTTTQPGMAYEYQVLRLGRDVVDVGYWTAGVALPAKAARGTAYVVVDQTLSEALQVHIERFARDLTGDGWQVVQTTAPRDDSTQPLKNLAQAQALRTWLQQRYQQDPGDRHAIILVGHVPIVTSGRARPDGHSFGPHATDLFYADVDGVWQTGPDGMLLANALPSNAIEMQIGRIDFSNLAQGAEELALLRAYFDKNHHWRTGLLGDLREAYAQSSHLRTEAYELRNIAGPDAVTTGGHHDIGEKKPWLWGVDFGKYRKQTDARNYANKAIFAINFGSHKLHFERPDNAMTALLAQRFYPLAVGWGGRPAWWLHLMALGGTIGDVHMRTVNNGVATQPYRTSMDYWPTGRYIWQNPIWVNLLGDPTLRAFMLAPPTALSARKDTHGVMLTWTHAHDPDVEGYLVYRIAQNGLMTPLNSGSELIPEGRFEDRDPSPDATYMVRAYGLKSVYAGSFYTLSQGIFAAIDDVAGAADPITVITSADQSTALPEAFNTPQDGVILAVIAPPDVGDLRLEHAAWRYYPPEGFSGEVDMSYARSDAGQTQVGRLTIVVTAYTSPAPAAVGDDK